MTPENVQRAAFLLRALDDIRDNLHPSEELRANAEKWKNDIEPLGMGDHDEEVELTIDCPDGGSSRMIATLDRGLVRAAMGWLCDAIILELGMLGVHVVVDAVVPEGGMGAEGDGK